MNDKNISLDELRERIKSIKKEVDAINDMVDRHDFFNRTTKKSETSRDTGEFHD